MIIPTYNRGYTIENAVQSVEAQTYRPLEIVVVDDASTDDTSELLRLLELSVPLSVIRHERNNGAAAARNSGIERCNGDFIAFLDSDDSWHPEKIENQIELLKASGPEFGVCYTGVNRLDERQRLISISRPTLSGDLLIPLLRYNCVDTFSSALVRKSVIQEIGLLDESLRSCQDWDFWVRLAHATKFAVIRDPLTSYTVGPTGRISTNPYARLSGHLSMYRKHIRQSLKAQPSGFSEFYYLIGDILMEMGKPKAARRFLAKSVRCGPTTSVLPLLAVGCAYMRINPRSYKSAITWFTRFLTQVHNLQLKRRLLGRSI